MIDQPVAIVCTGYGTHSRPRELVVLVPIRPRADLLQIVAATECSSPDHAVTEVPERGFGIESSSVTEDLRGRRVKRKSKHGDPRLINTPGIGWQVVGPGCPTCGGGLVLPVAVVTAYVAEHCADDTLRAEVDIRRARVG